MNVSKDVLNYQVVTRDGNGFHQTARMEVTMMTDRSYVGDLFDVKDNCIARDRRFFFENAITDQLTDGEKGMAKNEIPDDKWSVPEIKLYLDSKEIEYTEKMNKPELLALLEPKIEEVV